VTGPGEAVWRHQGDLAVVDSGDRVVVLDLASLAVPPQILEGSAAAIWRAVDGERATPEVVDSVAESFGVEAAEIEHDVTTFLASLATAGLLEASR
jgi:hypothetical protein